ncbi:Listeria/Bacterioides repeat-containing protein [Treponema bryantii]|uniref:Listeria/Bacterioides repeat-containing protein n=1 Tax=Treponema bryantii TaxID=163 RepID=A0A1I3IS87_9SPIR|nr:InlB B-repeat-containing protein [Treponema bryantii]SFI50811.1 Listeria/Bacterioides repeat-containing protein [Treponema bryantii]
MKKTLKTKFRFFSLMMIMLVILSAGNFTSCENTVRDDSSQITENQNQPTETPKTKVDKGTIQIKINPNQLNGLASRTALPQIEYDTITKVTLSGTRNGVTSTIKEWNSYYAISSVMIELGTWDLKLTVINNGKTFTSETETVEVETGLVKDVSFTLTSNSTEGGIKLYLDFEGAAVAATYRLFEYPSDTEIASGNLTVVTNTYKSVTFTRDAATNPVIAGHYRIEIKFYADAAKKILLNTYSEIVRVKGGFTSFSSNYIDLNNLYTITYHEDGGSLQTGSYVENYSLHTETFDLPTLSRAGYEFAGWYKDDTFTDGPYTKFIITNETSLGDKNYYAKWNRVCKITYYLANQAATTDSDCIELTEDQCEEWGLVQSHTQGHETELPSQYIENENGEHITLAGYTLETLNGTALTITGSNYIIPATVTTNTDIYVSVKSHIAYIDPATGNNNNLAFNPTTPARTIAGALKWLKNADSDKNPVLYVKSAITSDIGQLTGLSLDSSSGGQYGKAILKRYSGFTDDYLIKPSHGTITLENIIIDGGADWRESDAANAPALADDANVSDGYNKGVNVSAGLITVPAEVTLNMQNVTLRNNCSTATTISVYSGGVLDFQNCTITKCQSGNGGAIWAAGKIIASTITISYNYATTTGGAIHATILSNVRFQQSSFISNMAQDGGAIYNEARNNPLILDRASFTDNQATRLGTILFNAGDLTFYGTNTITNTSYTGDNTFYLSNGTNYPIVLGSDFLITSTKVIKLKPTAYYAGTSSAPSFTKQIFNFSNVSTNLATVKGYFELENANYEIDDSGVIKLIPGTVTVTPGFPGNYVCQWRQSLSGSTRTINIIVKDSSGHPLEVGTTAGTLNNVSVGIYEGADCVKDETVLSFTYPAYLDPPSGTPFYVKFDVQVDATTAYSYDYWPEQIWMGSKTPDQAKNVGDIVFNDGSAEPYVEGMTISDEQKAAAIALIFYKESGLNNGSDTTTVRTLGVGLKHNKSGLAWCTNDASAYSKQISTIQCTASGSGVSLTFTGDKNGSDNLEQIEAFEGVNDTSTEANYPAFYFAKNYNAQTIGSEALSRIAAGSEFENGWYFPSFAELFQIYANGKGSGKVFDIDAASQALGGDVFGTSYYWTSTQSAASNLSAYEFILDNGNWGNASKSMNICVCAIRAF